MSDPWLERWLPLLRDRAGTRPVLELGCGAGRDTATLVAAGHQVVGVDISSAALERARLAAPGARFYRQDLRDPLPIDNVGVVVASLALHYFEWSQTVDIVARIQNALAPGGALLVRVNSVNDIHYGARGYPSISDDFYSVHGERKRFFHRATVTSLFSSGWRTLSLEELVIRRFARPKTVWEILIEKEV